MKRTGWIVLGATLVACGGPSATHGGSNSASAGGETPHAAPMPHQTCVSGGGGDVQQLDVNGDGRADIRTVMRGGRPYCRETDANFDGRVDIVRFFDDQDRTVHVEDDYDFDGRIDLVADYQNGEIQHDVLDTNFDGRTDTWRDYRNGRIVQLRRDANGDGRVDLWETYDDSGHLVRTQVDADGDGQPDAEPDAGSLDNTTTTVQTTTTTPPPESNAPSADGGLGGTAPPTATGAGSPTQ